MVYTDTIAAIATALSSSGIGIIRISGSDAVAVAERMFEPAVAGKRLSEQKTYTIHYGYITDRGKEIDEVLVMIMRSPHSYTGEDTIEINCHGGVYIVKKILEDHGGKVWATSRLGIGTIMYFVLRKYQEVPMK